MLCALDASSMESEAAEVRGEEWADAGRGCEPLSAFPALRDFGSPGAASTG